MRNLRAIWAGLAMAAAGLAASSALAQATQQNLDVRDASSVVVATCAYNQSATVYPCHLMVGKDSGGNLRVIVTDTSGYPIVDVNGTVATNADASVTPGTAPSKALVGAGVYNASAPTITNGQSAALQLDASGRLIVDLAAGNVAQESGGNLAAAAASTATTATNTGRIPSQGQAAMSASTPVAIASNQSAVPVSQSGSWPVTANAGTNLNTSALAVETGGNLQAAATNTGATATEIGATSAPVAGTVNAQLGTIATNTTGAATTADQTNVQASAGSSSSKAIGVQGVAGGVAVGVSGTVTANAGSGTFAVSAASLPLPTGAATAANQPTINGDGGGQVHVMNFPATQPVSGTFWQATQPVSAAALPLPSNAAQETGGNLASAVTKLTTLNTTLGSPFQAGGAIGNTSFGISGTLPAFAATPTVNAAESGTWTLQPGNTANTTPWLFTMSQGGNTAAVTAAGAQKVDGSAVTQPVSGTFWQATQPVSLAALPALAAGSNTIGAISNTGFGITGALPAFAATPTVNLGTLNGAATAANQTSVEASAGASSSSALGVQGVSGGVALTVAAPGGGSSNGSTTITTGGSFQTLLASSSARKACTVQNPPTATEILYVSVGVATGSASVAAAFALLPGASWTCNQPGFVETSNIAVEAATTGHAFAETND